MVRRIGTVAAVAAVLACASAAAAHVAETVPLEPAAGARFDTTDTEVEFTVQREAEAPPWILALSAGDGGLGGTSGFMFFPDGRGR
jgi:hypothetical protein